MPWGDWQFWLVTAAAGWGAWVVVRPFLPRRSEEDSACSNCAVGTAARTRFESPASSEPSAEDPSG